MAKALYDQAMSFLACCSTTLSGLHQHWPPSCSSHMPHLLTVCVLNVFSIWSALLSNVFGAELFSSFTSLLACHLLGLGMGGDRVWRGRLVGRGSSSLQSPLLNQNSFILCALYIGVPHKISCEQRIPLP